MSGLDIIHVVVNPASGSRQTEQFHKDQLLPYLRQRCPDAEIVEHRTGASGDGVNVGRRISETHAKNGAGKGRTLNLIALGGDGTTHELLNGLFLRDRQTDTYSIPFAHVKLAIVPLGTANALYASLYAKEHGPTFDQDKLRSVRAMVDGGEADTDPYPLTLSVVRTSDGQQTLAHLITSHALHASILADSESLREQHPGIERFKMAFAQNMSNWHPASIELHPLTSGALQGKVQRYNPKTESFESVQAEEHKMAHDVVLYFACLTTDRLEPAFVPAPFSGPSCDRTELQRPKYEAVDVLIYRPLRNPQLNESADQDKVGTDFWTGSQSIDVRNRIGQSHLLQISGAMYQEGRHVNLKYSTREGAELDQELEEKGEGPVAVEYYRCGGYTWTPGNAKAQLTCIDGTVLESGLTSVRLLKQEEGAAQIRLCR